MRRLLTLTVFALALCAPGAAAASPAFVVTGAGWGHGIGMAQYGAYGFAQNGWTYDRILAHYYPGTELGPAPASRIRVLLAEGKASLEIASDAPFSVTDAGGKVALPTGAYELGPELTIAVDGKERQLALPVRFAPGRKPLRLGHHSYRGALVVSLAANGKLTAVNDAGLEQYLRGVVAGEMPADWHPEALRVQAVAARSYALASRKPEGPFDVYADTRSQVYGGVEAEDPRTTAAVKATKGQVVLYQGEVAWTFFSASSGGRTAAIEDVWAGAEPLPYLVSVEDPYDDISPYHRWGPITFTAEDLYAKLGPRLPEGLTDLVVNVNGSGRVSSVTAIGAGGTTELQGWAVRVLLGLRSTWFSIEKAGELTASAQRVVYGQKVTLSGVVEGSQEVAVEQRPRGGAWSELATVAADADGRFALTVRPTVTTSFRARYGSAVGQAVRVAVAPKVRLDGEQRAGRLAGTVVPALAGAAVTVDRRGASGWEAVASAVTDGKGRFRARFHVGPGEYRARVAPFGGLVAGTSPPLSIGAA